ncbi:putative quinol monooxygenase [Tenacibaculum ovolyticum]|uniref:putative quinol monooxygenase n=1 Tax=Tenacibaculum ovolyticum TaxID=104270 RepID=UPI0022F38FC1|nr:putative quinol monooxygenase [Tenacibaculum ovolyticum]WBX75127.1 putative quinol monooxygenase [Tenacibaculum ovolyticum]
MKNVIVAQISVKKEFNTEFLDFAEIMVAKSNNEDGCITYRLNKDVYNDSEYIFYEEYINKEAIDFHNTSSHFIDFINKISPMLLKEPIINIY